MRVHNTTRRPRHLVSGLILTAAATATLAACSASAGTPAQNPVPGQPATTASARAVVASSSPTPAAASPTSASTASGVSGTWTGQYSGSYSGTFTLSWQQTGSQLSGTIHLSFPDTDEHITGAVNGGSISFGTVGSAAITYSGTVSGNSMSGTYQVHDTQGSGGPWSATKS
jgi:hypothetical protein